MSHVFISYVKEDLIEVERLCSALRAKNIEVWLDREQIRPGYRWQSAIRKAIKEGAFYLACFSPAYVAREQTYMNEELTIAIEELRKRTNDRAWFVPIRLSKCEIPDRPIGAGETLRDIQWLDLYPDFDTAIVRLLGIIRPSTESRAASQLSIAVANELSPQAKELQEEKLAFNFTDGTELQEQPISSVLNGYYQDLLSGRLKGYTFSTSQINISTNVVYEALKQRVNSSAAVDKRRLLRKLEQSLLDGLIIALNRTYLGEKQVHYAYQTCFWYGRAVRSWIINILKTGAHPESPEELAFGAVSIESPLFGNRVAVEEFYGRELIKLDYWHPEKADAPSFSLFLSRDGYVGEWFTQHPLPPQPLKHHYSPNDHYDFVLPQMIMRHVLLDEPLIEDWSGYMVGAS